jgi:invasion protein IalB
MMRSDTRPLLLALATCLAAWAADGGPALAQATQPPKFISNFKDWTVYVVDGERGKVCYIASEPTKQEGNYTKRGNPAVLVARLPGDQPSDQVSVQPGYAYRKGTTVEVMVGPQKFDLFTQGEHAWARTNDDDKALIGAMRKGETMQVKGTSAKETNSSDTYSLAGFAPAYDAMKDACK